jgi:hypothetical protein
MCEIRTWSFLCPVTPDRNAASVSWRLRRIFCASTCALTGQVPIGPDSLYGFTKYRSVYALGILGTLVLQLDATGCGTRDPQFAFGQSTAATTSTATTSFFIAISLTHPKYSGPHAQASPPMVLRATRTVRCGIMGLSVCLVAPE